MSDETPETRDRGVEFGDLGGRLADASFPVDEVALLRSVGDHEIGLPDGEATTLESVLDPAGVEQFSSVDEVLVTGHHMLGRGAVGVAGRTGRGTSHLTPPTPIARRTRRVAKPTSSVCDRPPVILTDASPPEGWATGTEMVLHDEFADGTEETLRYERVDGSQAVHVTEIQPPKELGGWGYQVTVRSTEGSAGTVRELTRGSFEDRDAAREAALEHMRSHEDRAATAEGR